MTRPCEKTTLDRFSAGREPLAPQHVIAAGGSLQCPLEGRLTRSPVNEGSDRGNSIG